MFVYRFKIPPEFVDNNRVLLLINLLENLQTEGEDRLDLLPSRTDIMFASKRGITDQLLLWSKEIKQFSYEFEEHSDEFRTLTQVVYNEEKDKTEISTHFLLPLFPFDFYLTL